FIRGFRERLFNLLDFLSITGSQDRKIWLRAEILQICQIVDNPQLLDVEFLSHQVSQAFQRPGIRLPRSRNAHFLEWLANSLACLFSQRVECFSSLKLF